MSERSNSSKPLTATNSLLQAPQKRFAVLSVHLKKKKRLRSTLIKHEESARSHNPRRAACWCTRQQEENKVSLLQLPATRQHAATLRPGHCAHTSPLHSPPCSSCPPHSTGSSPNPPLLTLQLASPKKQSFNFEPNKHDCIYFPKDDKAHRGLDVQSYHFIYLVLLGKQISSHFQRQ